MGEKGWEEYKQAKIWRPSKELCWMITAIRIVWSACQYVRLVDVDICQVGWQGHGRGGSYDPATYQHWGEIAIYKKTKYCFSTLIAMSWEICRLVFLLQFICFWNNLLHAGLVQRREIENVSSLQFSSSFMAWGEGRLRTGRADKWESPSLVFPPLGGGRPLLADIAPF